MDLETQGQTLREHPTETKHRLVKAGVWREAERVLRKVKQTFHRRFKKAGGSLSLERRVEMAKAAWDAVHDHWPPPNGALPLESLIAYVQETQGPGKGRLTALPHLSAAAQRRFDQIGELDDLTGDAVWVYHNIDNPTVDPL